MILKEYATPEKILDAYGGPVHIKKPKLNQFGQFSTTFSRPIFFPKELLALYSPSKYLKKPEVSPPAE